MIGRTAARRRRGVPEAPLPRSGETGTRHVSDGNTRSPRSRRRGGIVVAAVGAVVVLSAVAVNSIAGGDGEPRTAPQEGSGRTLHVRPSAVGDCTADAPCGSIDAAYQKAESGDAILLKPGTYPAQTVRYREDADAFTANVVVRPEAGPVTIAGALSVEAPHVTVRGVTLGAGAQFVTSRPTQNADYGRLEAVTVTDGQVYFIGTDHVAVVNSRLKPATPNITALAVTAVNPGQHVPTDVLIENNEVGPTYATPDWRTKEIHNVAIHVLAGDRVTIRRNLVWEGGTSSSLQVASSLGPLSNILVEDNFVAGCGIRPVPPDRACAASFALAFSNVQGRPSSDIVARNNTVRGGMVDYGLLNANAASADISANIVEGDVSCSPAMRGNLFGRGSFGDCRSNELAVPAWTGPDHEGVSWGAAPGSPGEKLGARSGRQFQPPDGKRRTTG